jgi:hypothetical protein
VLNPRSIARLAGVCVAGVLAVTCGGGKDGGATAPPVVASITVGPTVPTLVPGATVQLAAVLKDASGNVLTSPGVTWSSSSDAVAHVSTAGLVTAVAAGAATITAAAGARSATVAVTVAEGGIVTPAGGTVSAFNSAVVLTVPAGAVTQTTQFTVQTLQLSSPDSSVVQGTLVDIGPTGTQFAKPVTLAIKYDPAKLRSFDAQKDLRLFTLDTATKQWALVGAQSAGSVDTVAHIVTGAIQHLTGYADASANEVRTVEFARISGSSVPAPQTLAVGDNALAFFTLSNASGSPVPAKQRLCVASDPTVIGASLESNSDNGSTEADCLVTARAPGTARLTSIADNVAGSVDITVVPTPSIGVTLSPNNFTVQQGASGSTSATITITENGFSEVVVLDASATPSWMAAVIPVDHLPKGQTGTLSVAVASAPQPGVFPITVRVSWDSPFNGRIFSGFATFLVTVTPSAVATPFTVTDNPGSGLAGVSQSTDGGATNSPVTPQNSRYSLTAPGLITATDFTVLGIYGKSLDVPGGSFDWQRDFDDNIITKPRCNLAFDISGSRSGCRARRAH